MSKYTVVARSRASAVFYPGKGFVAQCKTVTGHDVQLLFRTNYQSGFDAPLPTDFYVEATGNAANLAIASQVFHGTALEIANLIAFTTNADLGHLELELAFDSSPDQSEHEFVQTFVPHWPVMHVPGRPIEPEIVRYFLTEVQSHFEKRRIQIAIAQYCEALRRWNTGNGIVCLAHLYMGVEALTKASLREALKQNAMTEGELVRQWGIEKKNLDSEVRLRLIFCGDADCFKKARTVSDEFEHGYGDFLKMQEPASDTVVHVAAYLRAAIIRMAISDEALVSKMLCEPYANARGPMQLIKKVIGKLVGPLDQLAQKDHPYPALEWKTSIKTVQFDENGRFGFLPLEQITPVLGPEISLKLGSFEIWDNQLVDQKAAAAANKQVLRSEVVVESIKRA